MDLLLPHMIWMSSKRLVLYLLLHRTDFIITLTQRVGHDHVDTCEDSTDGMDSWNAVR